MLGWNKIGFCGWAIHLIVGKVFCVFKINVNRVNGYCARLVRRKCACVVSLNKQGSMVKPLSRAVIAA